MLSLFPELFTYQQIAPFILRLMLAIIFLRLGYLSLFKNGQIWTQIMGVFETVSGSLLLVGFLTQAAAISISLITVISIIKIKRGKSSWADYEYNFLVLTSAIALLFLGPGILSIDLPL